MSGRFDTVEVIIAWSQTTLIVAMGSTLSLVLIPLDRRAAFGIEGRVFCSVGHTPAASAQARRKGLAQVGS